MDREQGSPCPSGSRRRSPSRPSFRAAVAAGWVTILLALILVPGNAVARGRPLAATGATNPSAPLTLLAQTPWVTQGQHFVLRLEAGRALPASQLGVSIEVYSCLSSVSGFEQSVSAVPSGTPISSTSAPIAVANLPAAAGGGFNLSMPVIVGDQAQSTPGSFTIDLASAPDQCGLYPAGVYPVRVSLVDTASSQVIGGITTHLIYTDAAAGIQKLRFAFVLPLRTAIVAARTPTTSALISRPADAVGPSSPAAIDAVVDTVNAVAQHPTVPVTLDANAQTISALQSSGHQATVSRLSTLAASSGVHQIASSPFAPVNASSLVSADLNDELGQQIARGTGLISAQVTHRPSDPQHLGTWISNNALDPAALSQLHSDGYSQVIVPSSTVPSSPTNGSTARPFLMTSSTGDTLSAFASTLSPRFVGPVGNPVLAAHQLVAELAQIYYEEPNDDTPRAVVAVPPSMWSDSPAFVNALLSSLAGNPIIQSVTATDLFNTFPNATGCRVVCRSANQQSTTLPVNQIYTQRERINSFAVAAPSQHALTASLGDLVLAGESELLNPGQQSAILDNTRAALDAQLSQLVIASGQSITLTSQNGTLPIDIVSSASYPIEATLTVSSDKLLFQGGETGYAKPTTIVPGHARSNIINVAVRARTSGVFTVPITLTSPTGGLQLSSGQIVVRSTASSIVGIILSVGAVLVLAVWWIRTSRKRRAQRRADDRNGADLAADSP